VCELIIETKALTKNFGRIAAVKGVNLKVPKKAIYGFLGPMAQANLPQYGCYWI